MADVFEEYIDYCGTKAPLVKIHFGEKGVTVSSCVDQTLVSPLMDYDSFIQVHQTLINEALRFKQKIKGVMT